VRVIYTLSRTPHPNPLPQGARGLSGYLTLCPHSDEFWNLAGQKKCPEGIPGASRHSHWNPSWNGHPPANSFSHMASFSRTFSKKTFSSSRSARTGGFKGKFILKMFPFPLLLAVIRPPW